MVKINKVENADLHVYQMPNNFNDEYGTKGVFENNQVWVKVTDGTFTVPTDWTVYLVYNKKELQGEISLSTWSDKYVEED